MLAAIVLIYFSPRLPATYPNLATGAFQPGTPAPRDRCLEVMPGCARYDCARHPCALPLDASYLPGIS
jgi:hypothetical protein